MTSSHKSAGDGTSSANAVQTGSETNSGPLDGPVFNGAPASSVSFGPDDFAELRGRLDDLRQLRTLAEASSAWVDVYKGCQLEHAEVGGLFDLLAREMQNLHDTLEDYFGNLQLRAVQAAGVQQ